jgi:cytochrome b involved in lipid metabolism
MRLYANDNSNSAPQALSTVEIATVNINHAPVIDTLPISFVNDDASGAMLVSTLTSHITDVDANSLKGVAITGVNHGTLSYIDADVGDWIELTDLSSTNAFLLNDAASIYIKFVPDNGSAGTIADAIKFRAWDQTGGDVKETYVDISTTGGITAFSSQESNVSFDTSIFIPPIVLDLNQDGILNYSQSIMDVNDDGQLDQTAWAGKEEGVLIWDKYADGQVHDNSQYAFAQYGGKTDLSGLAAAFDTNHDGKFNAQDAKFDEFAVWQDANQNGISDAGEVYKLSDIGMISLNLNTDNVLRQPATGVTEFGQTSAQLTNGSSMLIADAAFAYTTIKLDDVLQSPASNVTPLIVNGESLDVSPFVDTHYQAASFYDVKTAQLMDDLVNQSM